MTETSIRLTDPRDADAIACLEAYYAELGERLKRGFDVSLSRDPEVEDMIAPRGAFFVAVVGDRARGCVGLKPMSKGIGEIKRLWVSPAARGQGLGAQLMAATETAALALGLPVLRLDTNSALPEASRLYQRLGWHEIDRYNDDPYPDLFFEKRLTSEPRP